MCLSGFLLIKIHVNCDNLWPDGCENSWRKKFAANTQQTNCLGMPCNLGQFVQTSS